MNEYPRDALLASSVNEGGVFLIEGRGIERLSKIDTTGMAAIPGGFLLARQAEGRAEFRRLVDRVAHRIVLTEQSLDLHDLLWHDNAIYVACTQLNTIYKLDEHFSEIRHWAMPGEQDSQHVNALCMHDGRLLASRFGRFEQQRGYKGFTRGAGEVFDVETGEVVIPGLSQPHSLKSVDGRLWVCDSETYALRAYRDFKVDAEYRFDGYVRGLAFGASEVYVGLSRSRNDPEGTLSSARVMVLDRKSMAPVTSIELPTREIYDLYIVDTDLDDLRAAALADAVAEFDTLSHFRNLAVNDAYVAQVEAARIGHALHLARGEKAELETRLAGLVETLSANQDELQDKALRVQEEAVWTGVLEAEAERLRQLVEHHEAYVERQAGALQGQEAFADDVTGSRSWRYTRPLRRIDPPQPARFEAAFKPADLAWRPDRAEVPIYGLEFDMHETPTVSIVVTAYGRFEETLACLKAIRRAGCAASYEVVLVEDCSGDREMERFRTVPGLRYHANPENLGFLRSASQACGLAKGEYVHFLNNDTLVRPGWLDALLGTFSVFHECGMAGSKLVYPDGRLQEAGGIVWSDGDACNYGKGDVPDKAKYDLAHEVDYVSGASLLLRTELLRELGGFDERYHPAYYEDTDLAFRVRAAGWKVYVQPRSVVVHHEGLSHGIDPDSGIKANQARNREVFISRWQETLEREQLSPGEHVFLAKDRAQLKKCVLIIDRHPPHTDRDAGSRAIWQLMRVLDLHGFSIKFWSQAASDDPRYEQLLRVHGFELLSDAEVEGGFDAWIAEHGRYLDYVLLSRPLVASEHIDAVRRHSPAVVLYYGHDLHHLRIEREYALHGKFGLDAHARHLQAVEEDLWSKSDLILYPSDEETRHVRAWLDARGLGARAATIPLFAYEAVPALPDAAAAGPGARRHLLFVGGFAHAPNADGVIWFATEVWPLVRSRQPDFRLVLVGADAPEEMLALAGDDVIVTGALPEEALIEQYNSARVAVAPLRFGAGTKGKVLEAMRFGVPCATTTTGAQGLQDATFLRVADDAATMAAQILELIDDSEAWRKASHEGQAFVLERFSVQSVWKVLADAMDATPYPDVAARRERLARPPRDAGKSDSDEQVPHA